MNNNNWWTDDDLPPPSMRQKYRHALVQRFLPSSRLSQQNRQSDKKDKILEQRLINLSMSKNENEIETLASLEERAKMLKMHNGNQDTPSVSDIEERLAKLRNVPVEGIRHSRSAVVNGDETEEETVEKLMRRAKDEAMLETKWDRSGESEEHDVDPEEFIRICRNDASFPDDLNEELSISNADIMGRDTIRNLKQLQRMMKLAKEQSIEAAKLTDAGNDNHSMDEEIKELMKLTNQSNMKSAKINEELTKFWERRLDQEVSSSESSDDDTEIDYEKLEKACAIFD
uniref:Fibrous sheath-interacting protein 1 n=1 Tax=Onchocerca volvulus TaxID=6282 RepID=A0A8R1TVJ1_ONCVO